MNRKYNPYVSLAALLLLALILVLVCTGCRAEAATDGAVVAVAERTGHANRYTYEVEHNGFGPSFYTITDTWTGNQYLFVKYGNGNGVGGGLTKLEE